MKHIRLERVKLNHGVIVMKLSVILFDELFLRGNCLMNLIIYENEMLSTAIKMLSKSCNLVRYIFFFTI